MSLLEIENLAVEFRTPGVTAHVVRGVSLSVEPGRTLGILGESGSGKSVLLKTILGLTHSPSTRISGSVRLGGVDLTALGEHAYAEVRGREVALVFQDALTALDPVYTIGRQLDETIARHQRLRRRERTEQAESLLRGVGLPSPRTVLRLHPHELSGGMRQRVLVAMALACKPRLLLADEPTTALDVTVQGQILALLADRQRRTGMAMVFVSHDIGVVASIAHDVAVMYAGRIVEAGPTEVVLRHPHHPYTRALVGANVVPGSRGRLRAIAGSPPAPERLPGGCAFAPRCPLATEACEAEEPSAAPAGPGRLVACWLPDGVEVPAAASA